LREGEWSLGASAQDDGRVRIRSLGTIKASLGELRRRAAGYACPAPAGVRRCSRSDCPPKSKSAWIGSPGRPDAPKTFYAREAILEYLDELEDLYLAELRLIDNRAGRSRTCTLEEVERELGLAGP